MILCTPTDKNSSFSRTAAMQMLVLYHIRALQQEDSLVRSSKTQRSSLSRH
jgi:hypothetical protein